MDNSMMNIPENFKGKSVMKKPEGALGAVVGFAGVGALLYFGLPIIITLMANTLTAIGLGIGLFAVLYLLLDNKFRNLMSFGYFSVMRAISQLFIEWDPIGIIDTYLAKMKKSLQEMGSQMGKLNGQINLLNRIIEENEREREKNMNLAQVANKIGNRGQVAVKSRQVGRLKDSNITLGALKNKLEMLYRVFAKMQEACEISIEDLENEIKVKKVEFDAMTASYNVFKSALKILKGDLDAKALFERSMEYLEMNTSEKLGEIEDFMRTSKNFLDGIDLQNLAYEEEAMKELEAWEKKSDSLMLGNFKAETIDLSFNSGSNEYEALIRR